MKDKQIPPSGAEPSIPVISAVLHCVSMTALVYFRSSFGFSYLSPKSVFFAFSWAFILFSIYAWNESSVWHEYRAACLFGVGAIVLYWLDLLNAFVREIYKKGEHDHYSGRSHPLRLTDSYAQRMHLDGAGGTRRALEMLALEGYRAGELSRGQVGQLLGLGFHDTELFLKNHHAEIPLSMEEFQRSSDALEKLISR